MQSPTLKETDNLQMRHSKVQACINLKKILIKFGVYVLTYLRSKAESRYSSKFWIENFFHTINCHLRIPINVISTYTKLVTH